MSEYGVGHEAVGHEGAGDEADGESWFERGAHPELADEEAEHEGGVLDGEGPADPQEWISGLIEDLLRAEQGIGAGPRDALMARIKLAQAYSELGDMVQAAPLAVENVFQAEQLFPSSEGMLRQLREFRDAACEAAGWTASMMRRPEPEEVEEGPSELVARPGVDGGDEVFDTAAAFADEGDLSDDEPTIEMDMAAVAPQETAADDAVQAVEGEHAAVADRVAQEAEAEQAAVADSVAEEATDGLAQAVEPAAVADSIGEEATDGVTQAVEPEHTAATDSLAEEATDGLAQAAESVADQTEAERGPVIDGFVPRTTEAVEKPEPGPEAPRGPFIADSQGVVEAAAIAIPEPTSPDYAEEVAPDSPFPTNDLVAYEEIVRLRYALREAQRTIDRLRYTNRKLREALEYEPE